MIERNLLKIGDNLQINMDYTTDTDEFLILTDDRIKCHVFICMLAYYVMWNMRQRLKPLTNADGVGENRKYSFDYILENLKAIRRETVNFMGAKTKVISTPNEKQTHILNLLWVKL